LTDCRALEVARLAQKRNGSRLHEGYPYLEAEVVYAVKEEMACTAVDVMARRLRLAFLDAEASYECAPKVIDIMGDILGWGEERKLDEMKMMDKYLYRMKFGRTGKLGDRAAPKNPDETKSIHLPISQSKPDDAGESPAPPSDHTAKEE
jgi:glycerol-3-phosphate dehydrogenase